MLLVLNLSLLVCVDKKVTELMRWGGHCISMSGTVIKQENAKAGIYLTELNPMHVITQYQLEFEHSTSPL